MSRRTTGGRGARGFSLIECLAALVILGFALLVGFSVVLWADRIEEQARDRARAAELAGSIAEALRMAPVDRIVPAAWDISDLSAPGGQAHVELEVEENRPLGLKRLAIIITWEAKRPGRLRLETAVGSVEVYQ